MTILPLKIKNFINEDLLDTIVFGENHKMHQKKPHIQQTFAITMVR